MTGTRPQDETEIDAEHGEVGRRATSRRAFLATVGVATVGLTALTAGQSVDLLDATNLFGARKQSNMPQGVPINRTANDAGVVTAANDAGWNLGVGGASSLALSRQALLALPQTAVSLPVSCVEGWSVSAQWVGVRVRDLMQQVGASSRAHVRFTSIEPNGVYRVSEMGPEFAQDDHTLVALVLNGEALSLDHGYPARLIAPDRPGVLQTKWLSKVEAV